MITIRTATALDWPGIWELFREVVATGESFAYDEQTPEAVARQLWLELPAQAFVAESAGQLLGTYYVRPNQPGRGAHVANAGYMIAPPARGQGLATLLCLHSLDTARQLGFRAMQFNYVVSTNVTAIHVWEKCGFAVVGRIPEAFRHDTLGFLDVLVFHRHL